MNDSDVCEPLLAQQLIRISNDLYGNGVCSSHELAKGFTRPAESGNLPKTVTEDVFKARETIMAKRKLNLILRSKSIQEPPVKVGDLVRVCIKLQHEKRGKCTSAKPVLSYDKASGILTVPGKNGKKIKAAVEDVRFSIVHDELAVNYQDAIDTLDIPLGESVDEIPDQDAEPDLTESEPDYSGEICSTHSMEVGERVEVYWSGDEEYYHGTVDSYDPDSGKHAVNYDDGDKEKLDMQENIWRLLHSNQAGVSDVSAVQTKALQEYFKLFGHKDFMLNQAEGLPPHPIWNAYRQEEAKFMKTVREVSVNKVPKGSNLVTSHVIYKVQANDDGSLKMKARIAPHGNKDKDRDLLKTDSAQCPPTGIRILVSVATIMKWPFAKIDFVSAFLQTGDAKRDVHVISPRECRRRSNYWLLLTSAYGLVNANAKWQEHCDYLFTNIGLTQSRFVPQ